MEFPKNLGPQTFTAGMVLQPMGTNVGRHSSMLEGQILSDRRGYLEWDIPGIDTYHEIGLWFERRPDGQLELTDYDGIHCLPHQAIVMLRDAGVMVDKDFE